VRDIHPEVYPVVRDMLPITRFTVGLGPGLSSHPFHCWARFKPVSLPFGKNKGGFKPVSLPFGKNKERF